MLKVFKEIKMLLICFFHSGAEVAQTLPPEMEHRKRLTSNYNSQYQCHLS